MHPTTPATLDKVLTLSQFLGQNPIKLPTFTMITLQFNDQVMISHVFVS